MEANEPGVLRRDGIYFRSASAYAKENLFCMLWGATYWLDAPYRIKRGYMDAFMLQYIVEGELHFELRGEHFVAKETELVLLSCQETNHYWSEGPSKVKWFHFHGENVQVIFDYIYAKNGNGHFNQFYAKKAEPYVDAALMALKDENTSYFQFSHYIYSILCELAASPPLVASPSKELISRSVDFMRSHYHEPILVHTIAARVGLSMYYFSRLFKQMMFQTPHAYLLNLRLDNAKKLLVYTAHGLDIIAVKTGFQSTSHFIRSFKQQTNMTPKVFRDYFSRKEVK